MSEREGPCQVKAFSFFLRECLFALKNMTASGHNRYVERTETSWRHQFTSSSISSCPNVQNVSLQVQNVRPEPKNQRHGPQGSTLHFEPQLSLNVTLRLWGYGWCSLSLSLFFSQFISYQFLLCRRAVCPKSKVDELWYDGMGSPPRTVFEPCLSTSCHKRRVSGNLLNKLTYKTIRRCWTSPSSSSYSFRLKPIVFADCLFCEEEVGKP
jgi:hypothetical protein